MRTVVIAAVGSRAGAKTVVTAAHGLAHVLGAEAEAVHVRAKRAAVPALAGHPQAAPLRVTEDDLVAALVAEAERPETECLAVGVRRSPRAEHAGLVLRVALSTPTAVLAVPLESPIGSVRCLLAPLDGTESATNAVRPICERMRAAGVDVVVLHVRRRADAPAFSDQVHHELDSWAREFLARHYPQLERSRFQFRSGVPEREVITAAEACDADIVALGWGRTLADGRASVIRGLLGRMRLPVLLLPAEQTTWPPAMRSTPS